MIRFIVIASGSKGNATLIYDNDTLLQIDMGVSKKALQSGLNVINKDISDIDALFITHEHSDHIKGLATLKKYHIPTYSSENTPIDNCEHFTDGEVLKIGNFYITPFKISHDAINPVGYLFINNDESLAYLTDSGIINEQNQILIKNKTYYIIESNHDTSMLFASKRPETLKKRIHCEHGHLSNEQSANYLAHIVGGQTKQIFLAHLSEECNTPSIALSTYLDIFKQSNIDLNNIKIRCLYQNKMVLGGNDEN